MSETALPLGQSRVGPTRSGGAVEAECPQDQGEPCNTAPATSLVYCHDCGHTTLRPHFCGDDPLSSDL